MKIVGCVGIVSGAFIFNLGLFLPGTLSACLMMFFGSTCSTA
jgi:hypothetical protein